jgi:hypothetical protein
MHSGNRVVVASWSKKAGRGGVPPNAGRYREPDKQREWFQQVLAIDTITQLAR